MPKKKAKIPAVKLPLPLVKKAILAQAKIPVPSLKDCLDNLNHMIEAQEISEQGFVAHLSRFKKLSNKSLELLRANSPEMSQILLCAKYLYESEQAEDQKKILKYKALYLETKELLRRKIGDRDFAALMSDCIKSSGKKGYEHFGVLFYSDAYCEPEFQHIADVANTVNLAAVATMPKVPKTIKTSSNLFGKEKEYELTPLKPGLGQVAVPKDPTKDNTVFVVCPDFEKLSKDPEKMLESFVKAGGQSVFNQIQKAIQASNLPEGWKAQIKVVGENAGAMVAEKCFEALQKGLRGELIGELEGLRNTPAGQFVQKKAENMLNKIGLKDALKTANELGGVSTLMQHVASLDFQNVQTSPLLDPQFRSAHPAYDQFLTDARIPQCFGLAGLVLTQAKNLKLDEVLKDADQKLQQYHQYQVLRPALEFVAKNAMPVLGSLMTGAKIGSTVPAMGTGLGALIGGGVGVCKLISEGYSLWKKKKQESLKMVAAERGVAIQSSFQPLEITLPYTPIARFSPPVEPHHKTSHPKLEKKKPKPKPKLKRIAPTQSKKMN